jgi:hypothetical protein
MYNRMTVYKGNISIIFNKDWEKKKKKGERERAEKAFVYEGIYENEKKKRLLFTYN